MVIEVSSTRQESLQAAEMRPTALFSLWCVVLDPARDGAVIDCETPLSHHLFQVAITACVSEVPTDAEQNDLSLDVTPFEGMLLLHEERSSLSAE